MIDIKAAVYLVLMLVLIHTELIAGSREILQPYWQAVNYSNSTTAYGEVTLDGFPVAEGDLVSAFINGECRGAQSVNVNENGSYVTLIINGEMPESVEFYLYSQSTREICDIDLSVWTSPGNSIGYPPDFLELDATSENANILPYVDLPLEIELIEPDVFSWEWGEDIFDLDNDHLLYDVILPDGGEISCGMPEWQVNSSSSSTQVFAEISINGNDAEEGDIAAAFIDGECRGTGEIELWSGSPFLSISVYGTDLESVDLKVYSGNLLYLCKDAFITNPGGMVGYPDLVEIDCDQMILESDLIFELIELPDNEAFLEINLADEPPVSQVSAEITIVNTNVNHPPQMFLPEIAFDEDTSFEMDLSAYITDPDGDEIILEIENSEVLIPELTGMQLSLYAPENWYGATEIVFLAFDSSRFYARDTLKVQVLPVNDPPYVVPVPLLTIPEDGTEVIDLGEFVTDVDDDSLAYSFSVSENVIVSNTEPQWQVITGSTWATGYFKLDMKGIIPAENSLLAAFHDGECRGIADLSVYAGEVYAIITLYCDQQTTMSFKAFESESLNIFTVELELDVVPGSNIGFPPDYYEIALDRQISNENYQFQPAPNWYGQEVIGFTVSDNEISIDFSVSIDVESVPDPPELNFPENQIFAAGIPDWIDISEYVSDPDEQNVMVELLSSGEINAELDEMTLSVEPPETSCGEHIFNFRAEDEDGLVSERALNVQIMPLVSGEYPIASGWNWRAFNYGNNHYQPNNVMSSIAGSADFFKGQRGFLIYNQGIGWSGSILDVSPYQLYKIHFIDDAELDYSGWDISDEEISISAGWNWISYLGRFPENINTALSELGDAGEYIKTQNGYAQYLPGYGWTGPLMELTPGLGYKLFANADAVFSYSSERISEHVLREPVQTSAYEFTGSITAKIKGHLPETGDVLSASARGKVIGLASFENNGFIQKPGTDEVICFIYLSNSNATNEKINLRYYSSTEDSWIDITESFIWQPDMIAGSVESPQILTLCSDTNEQQKELEVNIFPNPILKESGEIINIETSGSRSVDEIDVYNLKGQLVKSIDLKEKNGWDLKNNEGKNVAAGVYFLLIKADDFNLRRRVLVIK